MQIRQMKSLIIILTIMTILGCSDQTSDDKTDTTGIAISVDTTYVSRLATINQDSMDFLTAVTGLEDIQFYIAGQDSVVVTNDPTDLIELNTTKKAFHSSFAQSDTGLIKYKTVGLVRKYHVKRKDGKTGAKPSANIIQLTFSDKKEATDWFDVYDNSPSKKAIQEKPKTELWLDDNLVYFVQTYHTPKREYIDLLKKTLIEKTKNKALATTKN